jgi:3-hydroxyacyl-[acyl-carrier-protein] dehydratase
VRFLFYDRILEMEPGKHAVATKAVSIGDEFLSEHYRLKPVMPATLTLECLTQVAGWLYIATKEFAISTVLALAQEIVVHDHARPGDLLRLEAWLQFEHREGATVRAEATREGKPILSAGRLMFASRPLLDQDKINQARELFSYLSGGFALTGVGSRNGRSRL